MLSFVALMLARGIVLSALALLAVTIMRKALPGRISAAGRHTLCFTVLIALLLLPVSAGILPSWHVIPALPSRESEGPVVAPERAAMPHKGVSSSTSTKDTAASSPIAEYPEPSVHSLLSVSFPFIFVVIYDIGVLLFVVHMSYGHIRLWKLVRRARPVSVAGFEEMAVRESTQIRVPLTIGIGRFAVIVLPSDVVQRWTAERLKAVLLHEAAHIRRGDYLAQILADIACALHFPNPLAWFLNTALRNEAERAADDAAFLRGKILPSDYAEHLLAIVRELGRPIPVRAAVTMARHSEIGTRIAALLTTGAARSERAPRSILVSFFLVVAGITLSLSLLSSVQGEAIATDRFGAIIPDPHGYKRTLSDGTTIELISVAELFSDKNTKPSLWKPDGSSYQGPGPDKPPAREIRDTRANVVQREYIFHVQGPRADWQRYHLPLFRLAGLVADTQGNSFSYSLPSSKPNDSFSTLTSAFVSTQSQTALTTGLRSASQKIIGEIPVASIMGDSVTIQGRNMAGKLVGATFSKPKIRLTSGKPQVWFDCRMAENVTDYRIEVIAQTKNQWGKWEDTTLQPYSQSGIDRQYSTLIYERVRPEQIKTIRLIHQPYEWVQFDHIAMYPNKGIRDASTVSQNPDSQNKHSLTVKYVVPNDGRAHHIRIDVADSKGKRTIYNKWHKSGEVAMTDVEGEGEKITFTVYDNDEKVNEINGPPFKEKRN